MQQITGKTCGASARNIDNKKLSNFVNIEDIILA